MPSVEHLKKHAFKPGQSGNPNGRPTKQQWFKDKVGEDKLDAMLDKAVEMALSGKQQMMEFLLSRHLPAIESDNATNEVDFKTPGTQTEKGQRILDAVSEGRITPSQAHILFASLEKNVKLIESTDLQKRVEALEALKK